MPRVLAMAGDVRGRTILDLGCGEGGYARELCRRGGCVTGVDGSARLVEIAQQRTEAEGLEVRYVHANANALAGIERDPFDLVLASMSLMDVQDYRVDVVQPVTHLVEIRAHHRAGIPLTRLDLGEAHALGLDFGVEICFRHLMTLVEEATRIGNFVWIDMESTTYADPTPRRPSGHPQEDTACRRVCPRGPFGTNDHHGVAGAVEYGPPESAPPMGLERSTDGRLTGSRADKEKR